ncbi:low molecular weight [Carex littledalei]|uniref:acid phosphatase n=1 Tax=Carex littledalei TaxID=544730 RepID=A0A833VHU6_9POAL|nr:low molecular weight [Carex littledalei]
MSGLHGFCTSINPKLIRIYNPTTTNPFPNRTTTNLCLNHHHVISAVHLFSSSEALTLRRVSSMATATPSSSTDESKPFSVLFVCLGNICRSPAAEAVFRNLVEKRGLTSNFRIDSAGTIGYHEGNKADGRMRAASQRRGIEVTSISRPIRPSDFREFDLILAMDLQNKEDILSAYERWRFKEPLPPDAPKKVKLMCSYCKKHSEKEVPDPYYGGPQGFEKVLDLLEDACESMLDSIVQSQNAPTSAST